MSEPQVAPRSEFDIFDPDIYVAGRAARDLPRACAPSRRSTGTTSPDGRGYWAVMKYEDVVAISRDPSTFSSHARRDLHQGPHRRRPVGDADDDAQHGSAAARAVPQPRQARVRARVGARARAGDPRGGHATSSTTWRARGAATSSSTSRAQLPLRGDRRDDRRAATRIASASSTGRTAWSASTTPRCSRTSREAHGGGDADVPVRGRARRRRASTSRATTSSACS